MHSSSLLKDDIKSRFSNNIVYNDGRSSKDTLIGMESSNWTHEVLITVFLGHTVSSTKKNTPGS